MGPPNETSPRGDARQPRGLRDLSGPLLRRRAEMLATIQGVYDQFGFEPLETPAFEFVDSLGKFLPEQDRPDEGIFALKDSDDQWIGLRYDLTAPLSRYVAQQGQNLTLPFRRYQVGSVWRNEKPGPGRYREFIQFDADTIGSASPAADAENCLILRQAMRALGLGVDAVSIGVNNRKILDGVLAGIGFSEGQNDPRALIVLRAIDKFDRVGIEGVRDLLTGGRKDESGDFAPGAGLSDSQATAILAFMQAGRSSRAATLSALVDVVGGAARGQEGIAELQAIDAILTGLGIGDDEVRFDPSIVRGLGYYTGPVLEAQITLEILDDDGRPRQVGSIAGGGRYDGLVSRFTGKPMPATGVSIGVDRLLAALSQLQPSAMRASDGPVLVTVFDRTQLAAYQMMAAELREAGLRAEVFLGQGGLKAQLRYADRRNAPVAVIAGGDEFAAGTVSLKDLVEGQAMAGQIESRDAWREKSRAQITIPRAELVAQVRAILAAHS
ncbi:MAG: histidine--tRNA ligase [Alphaproteobacteria bacterium]|nr:histidine--tRNA ligase [Alphaproteobacteria bacterium]